MGSIFLYTTDSAKASAVKKISQKLGVSYSEITRADLTKTVFELVSGKPSANKTPLAPFYVQPELLLFSGVSNGVLDAFLAAYRNTGLTPINYKCVVTPHNIGWTLTALTAELAREHAEIG